MRSILDTRPKGAPGRDKPVPYAEIAALVVHATGPRWIETRQAGPDIVGATLVVARSALVVARSALVVARSALVVARSALVVARSALVVSLGSGCNSCVRRAGRHKGVPYGR